MRSLTPSSRGVSLIQTLAAIAILGVIAATTVTQVRGLREGAEHTKLESDVAAINQAISTYLANGGSMAEFASLSSESFVAEEDQSVVAMMMMEVEVGEEAAAEESNKAQQILDKLKTQLAAAEQSSFVGIRGSMVDKRLAARLMSSADQANGTPRAVWNSTKMRFEVATSGAGVEEFFFDQTFATKDFGEESRTNSVLDYNADSGWIWNYSDSAGPARPAPTIIPVTGDPPPPSGGSVPSANLDLIVIAEDTVASTGSGAPNLLANDLDPDGGGLTVTSYTAPQFGSLALAADGTVTSYLANPNYYGSDSFSYTVSDADGDTATATVQITVTPENDLPSLANASATIREAVNGSGSSMISGSVAGSVSDVDTEDVHTFSSSGAGNYGILNFAADGSYLYTLDDGNPIVDALGDGDELIEVYLVTVDDGNGGTDTANLSITIEGANDAPSLDGTLTSVNEKSDDMTPTVTSGVLTGSDPEGTPLVYASTAAPSYGVFTLDPDGAFTYELDNTHDEVDGLLPGGTLSETLEVEVTDSEGATTVSNVVMTIHGANDSPSFDATPVDPGSNNPVALPDTVSTDEDSGVVINATANDSDPDGDSLSANEVNGVALQAGTSTVLPSGAIVSLLNTGKFYYEPNLNFEALNAGDASTDSFTYSVDDGNGKVATSTVTIQIAGVDELTANSAYQISGDPGQLFRYEIDPLTEQLTYTQVGADLGGALNAGGYRESDGMIYALHRRTYELQRIDPNTGTITNLGDVGLTEHKTAGDFNPDDGYLYVRRSSRSQVDVIDVDNAQIVRSFQIASGIGSTNDFAFGGDGYLYGYDTTAKQIAKISPVDGSFSHLPTSGNIGPVGGFFTDSNGNLFGMINTGGLYQFDTVTGEATFITQSPPLGKHNDATGSKQFVSGFVKPSLFLDVDQDSGSSNYGFRAIYSFGGSPVPIADSDSKIVAFSDTNLTGATITLTNAQSGDQLTYTGLNGGINAALQITGGAIQLNLTGTASIGDYVGAIQGVRYLNTGSSSTGDPRFIQVQVTNANGGASDVKTASIIVFAEPAAAGDPIQAGTSASNDGAPITGSLLGAFHDPDIGDTHTFSGGPGTYGAFNIHPTTGAWHYEADQTNPVVTGLLPGQSLVDQVPVSVTDEGGLSDSKTLAVTVYGSNGPGPTPTQLDPPTIATNAPEFVPGALETVTVSLTDPNPTGSQVQYRIEGASWQIYTGPFDLAYASYPQGATIEGRATATSVSFTDSSIVSENVGVASVSSTLIAPVISPNASAFTPVSQEVVSVTITNPNDPSVSTLEYRLNGGAWQNYTTVFGLSMLDYYLTGVTIEARAIATDPGYSDSSISNANIGRPELKFTTYNLDVMIMDQLTILDHLINGSLELGTHFEFFYEDSETWHINDFNSNTTFTIFDYDYVEGNSGLGEFRVSVRYIGETEKEDRMTIRIENTIRLPEPEISFGVPSFVPGSAETALITLTDHSSNPGVISEVEYRLNGSAWTSYNTPFQVTYADYPTGVLVEARAESIANGYSDSDVASRTLGVAAP